MNVLFVCTARSWGGNEKWSTMAMNALADKGHQVTLVCRNKSLWEHRLVGVTSVAMPLFLHANPFTYIACTALLRRRRIDRVVSTKRAEYVVMGLLTRLRGIRHVIRLGIVREMDSRYREWVYGRLNDGIVVNAARTKDVLAECPAIDPDKVRLIYNGIPNPPAARTTLSRDDGRFRIVSVGALHPRKGFDRLIDAATALPEAHHSRIELVFVGDGPARADLERRAAAAGLSDRVRFTGFLSDPGPELEAADLFALITDNEGISNALLEAMVRGVPALTTDAGGTADFMKDGENGFFTGAEPAEVAERLAELMKRDDLERIGLKGRETVLDFFSLKRMADELEAFLEGSDAAAAGEGGR